MPVSGEYFGIWPGQVVSTDDPEKRGRVRVRVPQIYGDPINESEFIQDALLPWAEPCMPVTGVRTGMWWVPQIGAGVWVMFWQGDTDNPVYLGGWYPFVEQPPEAIYEGATPATLAMRTDAGHVFEMRDFEAQRKVQLTTAGGIQVQLVDAPAEGGPKVEITTPAGRKLTLDDSNGNIVVEGPTEVQVTAPSVVLGSSGGAKKRLATEDFVLTTYNAHTHAYIPGPGTGTVPSGPPLPLGVAGTDTTTSTTAD